MVTGVQVEPQSRLFKVTWNVPMPKTGPTNYSVRACELEVDGCEYVPPFCTESYVQGIFRGDIYLIIGSFGFRNHSEKSIVWLNQTSVHQG